MNERIAYTGITFDDVLLEPGYSEIVPAEVSVATRLTRGIKLNIPLLSSPMDTVTESNMAIALAQQGGLGVIHKNMSIDRQTEEVDMVKRSANGIIVDPVTLPPDASVETARKLMDQHNISGVPVTDSDRQLQGILTRRDLRFLEGSDLKIREVMTCENLVTATGTVTLAEAEKILMAKKVEKLLLVDEDYRLTGLITIKDVDMMKSFPNACKDSQGRLRVGGAVGVHDYERAESLMRQGVDVLVVDSAHGHSANVIETVRTIKKRWEIDVIAGNIATANGCRSRCDQSGYWTRFNLHDADHLWCGCSTDYGDLRGGQDDGNVGQCGPDYRGRWNSIQRRYHQGNRSGCPCRYGRRTPGRFGGKSWKTASLSGSYIQSLPRDGITRSDGQRVE
jgi:IMP dehydrogenase